MSSSKIICRLLRRLSLRFYSSLSITMSTEPPLESGSPVPFIVGACFAILAISFAIRSSIGLGMSQWHADFGWTKSSISGMGAFALCVMAAVVSLSGYVADRWGAKRVLVLGGIFLAGAAASIGNMHTLTAFAVGYGLFGGLGFGLASLPVAGSLIANSRPKRPGLATGFATAGSTGGQLIILPALAALFPTLGWRFSFYLLAIFCVIVSFSAYWLIGNSPRADSVTPQPARQAGFLARLVPIIKKPVFHALFWSFTLCGFTATGIVETHFIPFAQSCGFARIPSTLAYSLFAAANLVGMLVAGYLSDRMDRRKLLVGIYAIRTLAFFVPLFVHNNYPVLLMFSILIGIAFYASFPSTIGLSGVHFGVENLGLVVGVLTVGHAIGAAAGAYLSGYLYDLYLQYNQTWMMAIGLAALSAVLACAVRDPAARRRSSRTREALGAA